MDREKVYKPEGIRSTPSYKYLKSLLAQHERLVRDGKLKQAKQKESEIEAVIAAIKVGATEGVRPYKVEQLRLF